MAAMTALAAGQSGSPVTWQGDVNFLQQLTPAEAAAKQTALLNIYEQVRLWLNAHPNSGIELAAAPKAPLSADQVQKEIADLDKALDAIIKADPAHPFHLGITEVQVSANLSSLSPMASSATQEDIQLHASTNVAKALEMMPGVEIYHLSGNRNEAAFMIRGFSSNGQVPIYQDGIPMYVPYDGYIDMNRFLSSDIAEIQISRGYSSVLVGPGAMGGSVNLVTREPQRRFEGDAALGGFSGDGLFSSLRLGSRGKHYLAQATLDWLQNDFIPLSGNFHYATGGYTNLTYPYARNDHENQSASRDERWSARAGWLPREDDEYVFSFAKQIGQKGVPLYQGKNGAASFNNFWSWPYWEKISYYFLSNTKLPGQSDLKTRVYYDQFRNSIDMWDNGLYNSMTSYNKTKGSGAEISWYDDHTDGISAEYDTRKFRRNVIGITGFFKDDTHKERGYYPGATTVFPTIPNAALIPEKQLRDQVTSFAVQDQITVTDKLHVTGGFSADHLNGLKEAAYNAYGSPTTGTPANSVLLAYTCNSNPTNTSFSGCTAHFWNYNPQASASYTLSKSDVVFVTFADRGRFPTLKQRYSSGMGSSLPNPDLKPERSRNWNIGYTRNFGATTVASVQLYRMDLRDAIESEKVVDTNGLCTSNYISGVPTYCSMNINVGKETHQGVEMEVRSTPLRWLLFDGNYTYLNRSISTGSLPSGYTWYGSATTLTLPSGVPKNKAVGTLSFLLPYNVKAIVTELYEGGITLQDTTYSSTAAGYKPYKEAHGVTDLGFSVPVHSFEAQMGIKNVLDKNYYYSAGYPEIGRNWYFNMRYHF
ncbi:MAG: TonB-dependent receptor [Acidobacteriota bacterium]|nr:TonB-dependent receptor [Acidobacteriota bacterium]